MNRILLALILAILTPITHAEISYNEFLKCYMENNGATHADMARFSKVLKDAFAAGKVVVFENKSAFATTDSRTGMYLDAVTTNCALNFAATTPKANCDVLEMSTKWTSSLPTIKQTGIANRVYLNDLANAYVAEGGTTDSLYALFGQISDGLARGGKVELATLGKMSITAAGNLSITGERYTNQTEMYAVPPDLYIFTGTCSNGKTVNAAAPSGGTGAEPTTFTTLKKARTKNGVTLVQADTQFIQKLDGTTVYTTDNGTMNKWEHDGTYLYVMNSISTNVNNVRVVNIATGAIEFSVNSSTGVIEPLGVDIDSQSMSAYLAYRTSATSKRYVKTLSATGLGATATEIPSAFATIGNMTVGIDGGFLWRAAVKSGQTGFEIVSLGSLLPTFYEMNNAVYNNYGVMSTLNGDDVFGIDVINNVFYISIMPGFWDGYAANDWLYPGMTNSKIISWNPNNGQHTLIAGNNETSNGNDTQTRVNSPALSKLVWVGSIHHDGADIYFGENANIVKLSGGVLNTTIISTTKTSTLYGQ